MLFSAWLNEDKNTGFPKMKSENVWSGHLRMDENNNYPQRKHDTHIIFETISPSKSSHSKIKP